MSTRPKASMTAANAAITSIWFRHIELSDRQGFPSPVARPAGFFQRILAPAQ